MKTAHILIGTPGSGKSTWVKRNYLYDYPIESASKDFKVAVNSADLYRMQSDRYIWAQDDHKKVHGKCLATFIGDIYNDVENVIVDNTNYSIDLVAPYIEVASAFDYEVKVYVFLGCTAGEKAERNIHNVPVEVIRGMDKSIMNMLSSWPKRWPKPRVVPKDV